MADPNLLEGIDAPNLMEGVGEPHPIDPMQRLIIQNVFDSQPKRRKGYLEKLGWEMGPDENKIRPIGDKTPWKDVTSKIDPEFSDVYKKGKFFENFGENLKKVATEAGQDVGDFVGNLMDGALVSKSAFESGLLGSLGSPMLGVAAAFAGGAAGSLTAEAIKKQIGDELLNKDIPPDMSLAAMQAVVSGAFSSVGEAPAARKLLRDGGEGLANFVADRFKSSREGLKEAIKTAGGVNPQVLEKFSENPTLFSKEASAGGSERLRGVFRNYFGLDPEDWAPTRNPDKILPNSEFGKALAPLRASENAELQNIVADPKAKITYGDYIGQFLPKMEELMGQGRLKPKEQQALGVFKQEITDLAKDAGLDTQLRGFKSSTKKVEDNLANVASSFKTALRSVDDPDALKQLAHEMKVPGTTFDSPDQIKAKISNMADNFFQSGETEAIDRSLKKVGVAPLKETVEFTPQISDKEIGQIVSELSAKPMPFNKFTRNLDILQDKAFQKDDLTGYASTNEYVAQAAGTLRRLRDTVADESFARRKELGLAAAEPLSAIKAKQSEILSAYEKAPSLTPDKIKRAFLGKDSVAQNEIIGALDGFDQTLGTNFKSQLETGAFQAGVESMFKPGAYTPKGSSRVNIAALEGFADGAMKGGLGGLAAGGAASMAGGGTPAAVALGLGGGLIGGVRGASQAAKLANPESALAALAKNRGNEEALRAFASRIGAGGDVFGPQATSAAENLGESTLLREKLKDIGGGIEQRMTAEPAKPEEPNLLEGI